MKVSNGYGGTIELCRLRSIQKDGDEAFASLMQLEFFGKKSEKYEEFLPYMYRYPRARYVLNENKKACEIFCEDILKLGVTEEMELAFINGIRYFDEDSRCEVGSEAILLCLRKHGHEFSQKAREEMKKCCPETYKLMYPDS